MRIKPLYLLLFLLSAACAAPNQEVETKKNLDADLLDLISQMSVEEKVGQMTQINIDVISVGEIYNLEEPHKLDKTKLEKAMNEYHIGSFLNVGGHAYTVDHWNEIIAEIQSYALDDTGLKIPVVYGIDAIHGANYVSEGVLFPQPLAQAATFNRELVKAGAEITAYETRAAGIPWNFSPVLDLGRQPLWSRFFETYGEDVYLAEEMGSAVVQGYQGEGEMDEYHVAACMKHFLGYSNSFTGKDRTPVYLPERQLREYYLPPFQRAIEEGALTVMINSGEINGIPVHADESILVDLLRTELGFDGVAVTDWEDIIKLVKIHKVAPDLRSAVKMAVNAGIDMSMTPNDYEFNDHLIDLVNAGEVPMERIDESVYRVLLLKKRLGLFENPHSSAKVAYDKVGSEEHQLASYNTAAEAITLLKNINHALPLEKGTEVAVAGNALDSKIMLNGAWSRTWQGTDLTYENDDMHTLRTALEAENPNGVREVLLKQKDVKQDVFIFCLGEKPSTEKPGDIDNLSIDRQWIDGLTKFKEAYSGKMVLVLAQNRPRIIREIEPLFDAVVLAYQPGHYGADAVADVIFGDINPSGKLPFTYPRHPNTLLTYDHKYSETLDQNFGHEAFNPQYEFGYGLSYSNFTYSDLSVSADTLSSTGTFEVKVTVSNSGVKGKESVLVFVRDEVASITPAVKRLRAFDKVELDAEENKTITFEIQAKDLGFIDVNMNKVTEEGEFTVIVGDLSQTIYIKP